VSFWLAALAGTASGQPAVSQQNPVAAASTTGAEVAPRGQREVKNIAYGEWQKLCFKPAGAKMLCRTSITGAFATGQIAVRVDIIEREGGDASRLQLFAPVGMYLPAGVKLTVDQGSPHQAAYSWCLTNACIAAKVADPGMIQELDSGQTLRLEFVDSSLLSLTTSLPIARFASVRKGAPAHTFDQDIDE
jgi:invasion protein IalB